jgi:PiT family inorganic phosphate transporter
MATIYQGLANLHLDLSLVQAIAVASLFGIVAWGLFYTVIQKVGRATYRNLEKVERIFTALQIMTAAYVAFAHGANDVANAVGPLAAVITTIATGAVATKAGIPLWVMLLGGAGIVVGLASWGYRVIKTVGKSITELTPTRGFCAEFATASVVLTCSKLGLPMSTTHTLVGSVIGVGLARGLDAVNLRVMRSIIYSWLLTLPAAAGLTIFFYWIIRYLSGF